MGHGAVSFVMFHVPVTGSAYDFTMSFRLYIFCTCRCGLSAEEYRKNNCSKDRKDCKNNAGEIYIFKYDTGKVEDKMHYHSGYDGAELKIRTGNYDPKNKSITDPEKIAVNQTESKGTENHSRPYRHYLLKISEYHTSEKNLFCDCRCKDYSEELAYKSGITDAG